MSERLVLVDEQDNAIGSEEKLKAHQLGLLHRAFSVCIFRQVNDTWELLLQQRQHDKYHCGGLWTNTCCSHPRPEENIIDAGQRRLKEEMGFCTDLSQAGSFIYRADFDNGLTESEFDHVLVGYCSADEFPVNPEEVADYKWVEISKLRQDFDANPSKYTPWFAKAIEIALGHVLLSSHLLNREV